MSLIPHHSSDPVCALCELKLKDAHPYLSDWFRNKVKPAYKDAHVSWSFRNKAQQDDCVSSGKSKEPWPTSPHNKTPAMALDLFQINDQGKAVWNTEVFKTISESNQNSALPLVWGGDFISLHDYDHFEYRP